VKVAIGCLALATLIASAGAAQAQTDRRPGVEAGVRLRAVGPIHFDGMPANLTTADGRPYALFTLDNSLGAELGIEGHVSVPLAAAFRAEGAVTFGQPMLRTRVSGDVEGADPVTVDDRLMRLTVEGALVVQLRTGAAHAWFVRAGGGFSRGLTSDRSLLAKGTVATLGAGVKYWVRGGARRRGGFGVDAEGRVVARRQGLTLDAGRLHILPAAVAGLFFGF
jgi:hypothetical protein